MTVTRRVSTLLGALCIFTSLAAATVYAQESFRVAYGGYNETAAPMWVGIDKGFSRNTASMAQ